MDFLFMSFYIKKKYTQSVGEYFNVNKTSISHWRSSNSIPELRLLQFKDREGTLDIKELFSKIY